MGNRPGEVDIGEVFRLRTPILEAFEEADPNDPKVIPKIRPVPYYSHTL